jgi:hypothetical protein
MGKPTTRAQREAIARVYTRNPDGAASYREFRKRAHLRNSFMGCIMLPWCGMFLGIEPDGYTHS